MEQFPQSNEQEQPRQQLHLDLAGPEGNVFYVMVRARQKLEGNTLAELDRVLGEATRPNAGKTYEDILAIINSYMDLTDTSGLYPAYGPKEPEE